MSPAEFQKQFPAVFAAHLREVLTSADYRRHTERTDESSKTLERILNEILLETTRVAQDGPNARQSYRVHRIDLSAWDNQVTVSFTGPRLISGHADKGWLEETYYFPADASAQQLPSLLMEALSEEAIAALTAYASYAHAEHTARSEMCVARDALGVALRDDERLNNLLEGQVPHRPGHKVALPRWFGIIKQHLEVESLSAELRWEPKDESYSLLWRADCTRSRLGKRVQHAPMRGVLLP